MAGGEYLGFNNSIFLSERDSADRNSALGYFMRENMCYPPGEINITNPLDFYFQVRKNYVSSRIKFLSLYKMYSTFITYRLVPSR